jgi:hypothetical protein
MSNANGGNGAGSGANGPIAKCDPGDVTSIATAAISQASSTSLLDAASYNKRKSSSNSCGLRSCWRRFSKCFCNPLLRLAATTKRFLSFTANAIISLFAAVIAVVAAAFAAIAAAADALCTGMSRGGRGAVYSKISTAQNKRDYSLLLIK